MGNEQRIALITGGSRGIGRSIALALAKEGYPVALTYRENRIKAEETASQIISDGGRVLVVEMAMEDRKSIREALQTVRSELGRISILINNAAIAQEKPFGTITDNDWDAMLNVNLRGAFVCAQEVLPDMLEQSWGRIVNISSIGGQWGGVNQVHYAVSKAGLIGLTRSLAKIYSGKGITTNAVAPGLVATEMSALELNTEAGKEKVKNIPVGRIGYIAEVTSAVVYLVSSDASYITGQTININGGMYFG
ncbi:3-oxoacyl-ACP reductase family protein [Methylobacter sp. G7]|uniref:3-oxoacyl-ACP reductase family protein n=1 Tax=Methylobacter sp. G7 TaxID=3230117 RepID=UPI003D8003AC